MPTRQPQGSPVQHVDLSRDLQEDPESAPAAAAESSAGTRIGVAGPVEVVGEEGAPAT